MVSILISSESRYPVRRLQIRKTIEDYLKKIGIDDLEVSVIFVGERKIKELNNKWRKLNEATTVLTFGLEEPRGIDGILRVGDIVISYPEARQIAQEDNSTMDQTIDKLLIHGMNNLLGNKNDNSFLSQVPPPKI